MKPLQILKKPIKQSETIELVAPLKQASFRHPVEQQDPFDIVENLWKTPTNMTYGQDDTYRVKMMKALDEVEKVQALTTQALKAYIRLKASVSAISKDLAQKLQLKIEINDGTRVSSLGGNPKVKVVGLVKEASLSVEGTETILILGTDWFDRYKADIRRSDNKIEITY